MIAAGFAWALAGCSSVPDALNPINWYRDVMGLSADDDLGDNDNDQNLKEGGKEPYPNLASVPAPPDTALSSIDRDKLVDSLVADRNNAKYSAEDLRFLAARLVIADCTSVSALVIGWELSWLL